MSQNYTPVEWVDETTSQQGTLINKARLDQMQTAHHYADGFEEVDTIPTADPGVSYHKVVYCTADSTFYRWDGTAWTKDVDDDTKALLDQEIARATEAEGELARDIEDEATARAQADTALGVRITGVAQDVTAEQTRATARENAIAGDLADHEADTDNPHQVTKAQVGLGNVDNTSDLAKPVSTAQQAALDLKADNSNVVNSVNGLKGTVALYPANIPMGPGQATLQQRLDVDLDLINANTEAIGQEYDERVAAIASLQASVYTKTEADNLLAGKADKATTLAGYGITDAVNTTANQDVAGSKTFTDTAIFKHDDNNLILANPNYTSGTNPSSNKYNGLLFRGSTVTTQGWISHVAQTDGSTKFQLRTYNMAQAFKQVEIYAQADNNGYVTIPNRAYNASNTTDAVNLALLDAYPSMVRTANAQTIAGVKTFTSVIAGSAPGKYVGVCGPTQAASGQFYKMAEIDNLPNNDGVVFTIFAGLNGSVYARATYRVYRAGGVLYVQCLDRCYTTIYQKPKIYGIISGSGVIIYADTLSWCKPHLYLNYWEVQGEIYASMAQHTLTLSNDWSIIDPPSGIVEEVKLTSD